MMKQLELPIEVVDVFQHFMTCEFTTIGRTGQPITWPVLPIYWREQGMFAVMTSIGLPQKAYNARRDPHVSLLYSDPTGSTLIDPPAVLVQGTAQVSKEVIASFDELEPSLARALQKQGQMLAERQPSMALYMNNSLTRYLMDWYFMRLLLTVRPSRVWWWDRGDFGGAYHCWEAGDVVAH
jgi:hypothetical protein